MLLLFLRLVGPSTSASALAESLGTSDLNARELISVGCNGPTGAHCDESTYVGAESDSGLNPTCK